ncbi:hypothetical protein PINS_up010586 [Pythium insidiosum]|nr:hypothetical protein PINS_up010586 [Pythium insidiosum]
MMFFLNWKHDKVQAIVTAANSFDAAEFPSWLTPNPEPPLLTGSSLINAVMKCISRGFQAFNQHGEFMLGPCDVQQFTNIIVRLASVQQDPFLQRAAQKAFPRGVDYCQLAEMFCLELSRPHRVERLKLPDTYNAEGQHLHHLFSY